MKHRIITFFLLALSSLVMKVSHGQAIDSMINVYAEQSPKEKIHVHFDKTIYNKEETIWYKIYILDDQGLTQLSKNVYMECTKLSP